MEFVMNFYTVESLRDGAQIEASGVDIMLMSAAFKVIDKKSDLKTLDNVIEYPFVFLEKPYQFSDTSLFIFAEQSKKMTFALMKEHTPFKITDGKQEYFCAIHEGKLQAYKHEQDLNHALGQSSIKATDPVEAKALDWIEHGRVGLSSATMCVTLFPNLKSHHRFKGMYDFDGKFEINWPHDDGDFKRCLMFLEAVPEARLGLDQLKSLSPEWKNLVTKWDEIEALSQAGNSKQVYDVISQCVKIKKMKP